MHRRHALTRVDLLACATLGTLLAGCLLPALAQQRDADARQRSVNNLKQIALAVHNSNHAYDKLPPLVDVGPGAPTGAGLQSLFFNLLPFIEQDKVYRLFNRATPATYYGAQNGVARTVIKPYISPADGTAPDGTTQTLTVTVNPAPPAPFVASFTGTYATTSYAANGLVPWNTGDIPRTFRDGTSNTIMFGERAQVCKPKEGDPVYNLWALGVYAPSMPAFGVLAPANQVSTNQVAPDGKLPLQWIDAPIPLLIGKQDGRPGAKLYPFQAAPGANACDPQVAQTPHADGMLAALADGTVRVLSPKISQYTFWAACTPNGNETLGKDW
jgi:hypothetical protein